MLQMPNRVPVRPVLLMAALGLILACGQAGPATLPPGEGLLADDVIASSEPESGDPAQQAPASLTPKPVSTTAMPTTTVLQDGLGDGFSCVTGEPLTETPPGIDISGANVVWLLNPDTGEPEEVLFTMELDQAPAPNTALFGGVEFADTARAISPLNPQWHLDGIGNQNFSFTSRGANVVPELHQFDPVTGWTASANTGFWVEIDGNRIFIHVPVGEIPANSLFYIAVSDYTACDAVGLDDNRQPTGELPSYDALGVLREATPGG